MARNTGRGSTWSPPNTNTGAFDRTRGGELRPTVPVTRAQRRAAIAIVDRANQTGRPFRDSVRKIAQALRRENRERP